MKTIINDGLKFVCSTEEEKWRARTLLTKEPGTIAWLNRVLKPGDVFYDIGANVGCYSLYAARLVGHTGKVYAFEPHPGNAMTLLRNVEANGFGHVQVVTTPLAGESGPAVFRWAGSNVEFGTWQTRLDDWLDVDSHDAWPNVIKIDVDGPEPEILAGMFMCLLSVKSMLVEQSPRNRAAIEKRMGDIGYHPAGSHLTDAEQKKMQQMQDGSEWVNLTWNCIYEPAPVLEAA